MNAAERQPVAVQAEAPSTSMALVPIRGDRRPDGPRLVGPGERGPANVHRLFFAMGYAGLAMILAGAWISASGSEAMYLCYVPGGLLVGSGGLGVLIHTLVRMNERKLRHLLAALASLGLTLAAVPRVEHVSSDVRAAARVRQLQPLAQEIARDGRIRSMAFYPGGVWINGYQGPEFTGPEGTGPVRPHPSGTPPPTMDEVLRRDGIIRAELQVYRRRLDALRVGSAVAGPGYVAFEEEGLYDQRLMYVHPGHALPPRHVRIGDFPRWSLEPLGGDWYLLLRD